MAALLRLSDPSYAEKFFSSLGPLDSAMAACRRLIAKCVLGLCCLAVVAGCSPRGRLEPPRHRVSGKVTLDSSPLQDGAILFLSPDLGIIDRIPIRKGRFQGLAAVGKRRVEFSVVEEVPFAGTPMPGVPSPKTVRQQVLPSRYHAESTLSADVTPGGANEFSFDLKSK